MDGLESQVVITSIQKAVTVAGWVFVFNFGAGCSSPSSRWICADNLTKLFIDSGMIVDILQALVGQTTAI